MSLYWLLWHSAIVFGALFLFTEGFLLSRLELRANNTQTDSVAQFDRVVLVIVDALRFDFVYFNTSLSANESASTANFYHNKFNVVHELIRNAPSQARLFKFLADPPTVTMQRLKGLTTGGLPTFIDVKDNFASSAITEDNIIAQITRHGKKVVMMGDDTWMSLFPTEFEHAFPFPSFNVKDLHTVDNGVLTHLLPSILQSDPTHGTKWDFLIAHFLGVDHVGHRYGPTHEWMTKKLQQMNAVVGHVVCAIDPTCPINLQPIPAFENVQAAIPPLGDHFPSRNRTLVLVMGDHGMTQKGEHGGATSEETGAGLFVYSSYPIFSEHLTIPSRKELNRAKLWTGEEYATIPQIDLVPTLALAMGLPIPYGNLGTLIPELFMGQTPQTASSSSRLRAYGSLLKALRANSQQVWNYLQAYSLLSSTFGDTMKSLALELEAANQKFSENLGEEATLVLIEQYQTFLTSASEMCRTKWTQFKLFSMMLAIFLLAIGLTCLALVTACDDATTVFNRANFGLLLAVVVACVGYSLGLEPAYLCWQIPLSLILGLSVGSWKGVKVRDVISRCDKCAVLCWVVYMQGLFSNSFIVSEHQVSIFLATTVWLASGTSNVAHVIVGVLARLLGKGTNFSPDGNFSSLSHVECAMCVGAMIILVALPLLLPQKSVHNRVYMLGFCSLQALAIGGFWSGWGRLVLPRFVYCTSLLGLCFLYTLARRFTKPVLTVYNFALWTGPLVLLLGPRSPILVATLVALTTGMCLTPTPKQQQSAVSFSEATFLYFVIVSLFYATGHRLGFESIPASCAFVGFDEFNLYLGGLFVVLHCFSGHILGLFAFAVILSHRTSGNQLVVSTPIMQLSFCFSLRLLLTMINVTMQRRHLMVWAIFAPKYVFDGLTGICVQCLLLMVQFLVS